MKISFSQPAFIPWGGYFARLISSDKMVLLDMTQLAKGFTFVNRNRIKGPGGEIWLTVPLKRKGRGLQQIHELKIHEKERWGKGFLLTLQHFYGKSIYFPPILEQIKTRLNDPDEDFLKMVVALLEALKRGLGIDRELILQSGTGVTGRGTPLLVALAKDLGAREVILPYFSERAIDGRLFRNESIGLKFMRYDPPQYPQFWGKFLPNLSVLDLLLCLGKNGRMIVEKGIKMYGENLSFS
jgi:hypothetical protein